MANIFELPSKGENISPEKANESRKCTFATKVGSLLSMRSFAIEEAPSKLPALYATLEGVMTIVEVRIMLEVKLMVGGGDDDGGGEDDGGGAAQRSKTFYW